MGVPINKQLIYQARFQNGTKLILKEDMPNGEHKQGEIFVSHGIVDDKHNLTGAWGRKNGKQTSINIEEMYNLFAITH